MTLKIREPKNRNYCAIVTVLDKFVTLPNCDNVKGALIYGNHIIVGKEAQAGDMGLYFPVECQLSAEFLGKNNLYRKNEWGNKDEGKGGFFEQHGRVKAVKFRGHKSEGFWLPLASLNYLASEYIHPCDVLVVGMEFDELFDQPICQKYVPKQNPLSTRKLQGRQPRLEDSIVDGQFRFHIDTDNLRRNVHKINVEDIIVITEKWHGTSCVIANILTKRYLPWYEKVARALGVKVQETEYGYTWSSRRVVKGVKGESKATAAHYYDSDVWGATANYYQSQVPKGFTVYGEIVGFTNTGSPIQPGYHYSCGPKSSRFLVYRVTSTNMEGKVIELSWPQLKEFCVKHGFEHVKELYYGTAEEYFNSRASHRWMSFLGIADATNWQPCLLKQLEEEYIKEDMCEHNNFEVPTEGIVVRVEHLEGVECYKLKNFRFLEWETKQLDSGNVDIETQQSEVLADQI